MKEELIMASWNEGKIKEAQEILENYNILSIKDFDTKIDIEEDEDTFEKNAIKKSESIAKIFEGRKCLADDSGIEIEYLGGFPGVQTKRWLKGTDREKNLAILEKLKGVPKENRNVKFICAVAVSDGRTTYSATGEIIGKVSEEVRGENGFGFDEVFELPNGKTLAELLPEEKNEISARKKALEALKETLQNI